MGIAVVLDRTYLNLPLRKCKCLIERGLYNVKQSKTPKTVILGCKVSKKNANVNANDNFFLFITNFGLKFSLVSMVVSLRGLFETV